MKLTKLFNEFFNSEKAGGLILVILTVISLSLANSVFQLQYIGFWETKIGPHTLTEWINDALMAIFFLLIGLELEREIYHGELSDIKKSMLPVLGALGGMVIPAAIFTSLNFGTNTQSGAGIPVATDIAFAIGILSILGKRVPVGLKVFLTALAVIDDLGAIIVIALFYTSSLNLLNLLLSLGIFGVLIILNRLKVKNLSPFIVGGVVMWYFMMNSGVHATIAGVLLAFAIPIGKPSEKSPSSWLEHYLNKPVAFFILPLFAMANTCIPLETDSIGELGQNSSLGIMLGLVLGKPIGITLFAFIGVSAGLCRLPRGVNWNSILGAGMLGGIGFTMSIFITMLAYDSKDLINSSKIAILTASLIASIIGLFYLRFTLKTNLKED